MENAVPPSPQGTSAISSPPAVTPGQSRAPGMALAVLRILVGSIFLWAFVDKTFGLGQGTAPEGSWLAGGRPTAGYLNSLEGTLASLFQSLTAHVWGDWVFMAGLLLLGLALLLGAALHAAAVGGTVLMGLMWLSALPLAQHPVVDEHVIYAAVLWVLALTRAGRVWGLGRR